MAKSLVIHIGDPKTGTTSIQEVLLRRLFDTSTVTVDYPDQLNHFPLANALIDPKQAATRGPRFRKIATWARESPADVAIISAEQFFRVDPQKLQDTLDEYVPEFATTARVIGYVRPHASRFVSAYIQRTRSGLYMEDMNSFFEVTKKEKLLRYTPRFEGWRRVFGDRFTLRTMIRQELLNGDVVSDFMNTALEGAPVTLKNYKEINSSLPLEYLAGMREVQRVLKRNKIAPGTRNLVGDQIGRTLVEKGAPAGTKVQLTAELYEKIRDFYASDAADLDAAFFSKPIMTQAMEEAKTATVEIDPPSKAAAYYDTEAIQALKSSALKLVTYFTNRPTAWPLTFERKIGQRPPPKEGAEVPPANLQNARRVDAALNEIVEVIAKSTGSAKG